MVKNMSRDRYEKQIDEEARRKLQTEIKRQERKTGKRSRITKGEKAKLVTAFKKYLRRRR